MASEWVIRRKLQKKMKRRKYNPCKACGEHGCRIKFTLHVTERRVSRRCSACGHIEDQYWTGRPG